MRRLISSNVNSLAALGLLACLILSACAPSSASRVDIPAGSAAETLKVFAEQTRVEIVFDTQSVQNINTNAVSGHMTPRQAIEAMLAGTPLALESDPQARAFAVTLPPRTKS